MPYNIQAEFPFPSCPKMPCYSSKPDLSSQVRGTCRTLLGTCLLHPPALSLLTQSAPAISMAGCYPLAQSAWPQASCLLEFSRFPSNLMSC